MGFLKDLFKDLLSDAGSNNGANAQPDYIGLPQMNYVKKYAPSYEQLLEEIYEQCLVARKATELCYKKSFNMYNKKVTFYDIHDSWDCDSKKYVEESLGGIIFFKMPDGSAYGYFDSSILSSTPIVRKPATPDGCNEIDDLKCAIKIYNWNSIFNSLLVEDNVPVLQYVERPDSYQDDEDDEEDEEELRAKRRAEEREAYIKEREEKEEAERKAMQQREWDRQYAMEQRAEYVKNFENEYGSTPENTPYDNDIF